MKTYRNLCLILAIGMLLSCGEGFLDQKPAIRQRVPSSLQDYLGLLDNISNMNSSSHALGMIGGDELYLTLEAYNNFPTNVNHNYQKRAYTWEEEIFEGNEAYLLDWNSGYSRILWANLVLDGLKASTKIDGAKEEVELVRGMALFHRAWNYYCLAQLFCPVYEAENAGNAIGLPLRLEADLTVRIPRSNLASTYNQIIADLQEAEELLPAKPAVVFRPSKAAVYALLAKVYMQMGEYAEAYRFADACIGVFDQLLDFNGLDGESVFEAYGANNPEMIFYAVCQGNLSYLRLLAFNYSNPDTTLMASYADDDLRGRFYFSTDGLGIKRYSGSYDGSTPYNYFTGLAVDEMYLVRAESAVRTGNPQQAWNDLNALRKNRFNTGSDFGNMPADAETLLRMILEERRKELVFRGTRWEDIRRLNKEDRYQITLTRILGDQIYRLEPGSPRFIWPLPVEALMFGGYQ